jgi:hypothetical protein
MEVFDANEFIQPGNGYSAKYALSMLSGGNKTNKGTYKKVSEMYSDLAIPAGLYVKPELELENHYTSESNEVMPEDLYSKLFSLAEPKKKKLTRRKRVEKSEKTEKKKGKKKTKRVRFNL